MDMCFAVVIILVCVVTSEKIIQLTMKNQYVPGQVIESFQPSGFQQCIKICESRTACSLINFDLRSFTCELVTHLNPQNIIQEYRKDYIYAVMNNTGVCTEYNCSHHSICLRSRVGTQICQRTCKNKDFEMLRDVDNKCFKIDPSLKTWDESRQHCKSIGSRLAIINSEIKFQAVFKMKRYIKINGDHKWIWIGGNDTEKEAEWRWTTGELVSTGEIWSRVIMDGGIFANCLHFWIKGFYDLDCNLKLDHLCEEL